MTRLVYLGTPELAVPPLQALVAAGHEVVQVVSRPDRRRGRGGTLVPSAVKAAALELGLEVSDDLAGVAESGAALGVVVAYGRIVPVRVLDRLPMVNLHFSLLPRWRGAAPVERAILAGDAETGVCVMAVEEGLDTGPVYAKTAVPVGAGEHLAALRQRLVDIGSALLVEVLAGGVAGLPTAEPQQGEPVYAEKLRPEEFALAWDRSAEHLARVVRLDRAFTTFRGRRLRVLEAEAVPPAPAPAPAPAPSPAPAPGTMAGDEVVTGGGRLRLVTVQPEGRAPMPAADWRRGARPAPDERLG